MAVLPMARINIYGLKHDRKGVLEELQRLGAVDVRTFDETEGFERPDTYASIARFQKAKNDAKAALDVLEKYSPEKKSLFASLEGRKPISYKHYERCVERRDAILNSVSEILKLEKSMADFKAEKLRCEASIEALMPWEPLPYALNYKGTRKAAAYIGVFPEQRTEDNLLDEFDEVCKNQKADELAGSIHLEVISTGATQTYAFILCARAAAERTEELLRHMGFSAPSVVCEVEPRKKIAELKAAIEAVENGIKSAETEIVGHSEEREDLKFMTDYLTMRTDKYKVISQLGQSKSVFALTGYVPLRDTERVEKQLSDKFSIAYESEKADSDDVPVALQNNAFAAPLEGVLETFSLPGRGEVDPTAAMAVFYYFLFGLMLSDAAYGIIMIAVCAIALWKFPRMETGLRKSLKMFLYCGISTTFWGVMFGGYFGDAIQVIAKTFFNKDIVINPVWFSPLNEPMRMLMFSLGVGIVHLFAGLGMKLYSLMRDKKYKDALYDVIFWYMLVGGAIVYLLSAPMFIEMSGLGFMLPASVGRGAAIVALLGAIGIALTAGRSSQNPFKRLAKGLYELYNVTGYLSDILSYSRLLALGLATGVIANVFNKMGSMMGGGVLGAIFFAIIFVVGHTLNIGINLLGAYVHTNRLQFVEFFGKFYEGGGTKYSPFRAETGYFEIENDNN